MTTLLEQLGSELSFIRAHNLHCKWNAFLQFFRITLESPLIITNHQIPESVSSVQNTIHGEF